MNTLFFIYIHEILLLFNFNEISSIEKWIIGEWKPYYGLENHWKSVDLWSWDKKKLLFETLGTLVIIYGGEVWGCSISRDSLRKIEQIQKNFISYNLRIK
jgi:hypothetical protein